MSTAQLKPGFNREKLRRFMMKNKDLHAAYLKLHEDIGFLAREQIPPFERRLKEASEKAGLNHNREVFNARNEGRTPVEFANFMDYPLDKMLESYVSHPIRKHIDYGILQKYVRYTLELNALKDHQERIQEELKPRRHLVDRCLEFLKNQGLTPDEIGLEANW
ncbi:hypothetical protein [Methylotuvimicrobium sp. KM1]|uniref:hypothetical protein n=1 Tax=Methylotuvimicrobium sp. KM1 TaxID=3377707 RepID=UPI00384A4789